MKKTTHLFVLLVVVLICTMWSACVWPKISDQLQSTPDTVNIETFDSTRVINTPSTDSSSVK